MGDQESTTSSPTTIPGSSPRWKSCSASTSTSTASTTTTTTAKPHKAQQAGWEAMKALGGAQVGLDHFQILTRVGGGDIGNVYLCQIRNPLVGAPPCYYAMKVVDREALQIRKKIGRADMEREILGMLDHPFLPTLYAQFDASHYSCFLMEFCPGGDLFALRLRQPSRRFSISSAKFYGAETLLALEYLHMMGIIYRDLKPENVLVREDGHIMLTDFDLSLKCDVVPQLLKHKNPPKYSSCVSPLQCFTKSKLSTRATSIISEVVAEPVNAKSRSFVGTHEYLAPEVISGQGHGSEVDWWTFGVFLYEMIYGKTPFKGENNEKTLFNIMKQGLVFPKSGKESEEMKRAQDLISKLLVKNPKKRIGSVKGSNEIKRHEFFKGVNWALIRSVKPPLVPKEGVMTVPKPLCKKQRDLPFQPPHHFDYF